MKPLCVALIRGVGPADPRKSNASLTAAMSALGLGDLTPVASSGNIIFSHDGARSAEELSDLLESTWSGTLGFEATTIVRSYDDLRTLLAALPFDSQPDAQPHGTSAYRLVTFGRHGDLSPQPAPPEMALAVLGSASGALCTLSDATVTGTPDAMRWLEKTYSKAITSRTPGALEKIVARMEKVAG